MTFDNVPPGSETANDEVTVAHLAIGTELLRSVVELNMHVLGQHLEGLGWELIYGTIARDVPPQIGRMLEFLANTCDVVVLSGGTGTTPDDRTRALLATMTGLPLVVDPALEAEIHERMLDNRWGQQDYSPTALQQGARRQASIVEGATPLRPIGTASGMVLTGMLGSAIVVMLPGPPEEFVRMWLAAVESPSLAALPRRGPILARRTLRAFGLESEFAASWAELEATGRLALLKPSMCWKHGEGEIVVEFAHGDLAAAAADAFEADLLERHGAAVFSRDGSTIDEILGPLLHGKTLAVADAFTWERLGGWLGKAGDAVGFRVRAVGGNGHDALPELVVIPDDLVETDGPASPELVAVAAQGAIGEFDADLGVAVAATPDDHMWTIYLHVAGRDGDGLHRELRLSDETEDLRQRVVVEALHLIRQFLQQRLTA
jgi:nicotinamide-nucleotide amidase